MRAPLRVFLLSITFAGPLLRAVATPAAADDSIGFVPKAVARSVDVGADHRGGAALRFKSMKSVGHMKRLIGMLICATFAAAAVAADSTSHQAAEQVAIKHARAAQNAAILRHDVDAVTSFWTDDVTICRGLGTQLAGKAAYRQLFAEDQGSPTEIVYQRHPTAIEASGLWPLAFETGQWEGRQGQTGTVVVRGRYSAQWVKRGDAWLIRSEVFVALQGAGAGLEMKAAP